MAFANARSTTTSTILKHKKSGFSLFAKNSRNRKTSVLRKTRSYYVTFTRQTWILRSVWTG